MQASDEIIIHEKQSNIDTLASHKNNKPQNPRISERGSQMNSMKSLIERKEKIRRERNKRKHGETMGKRGLQ